MARIRTIKPEFWSSEQVVELSPTARLLFIGLWNFCDDAGNHPASPKTLKMEVFPGDDFTAQQIGEFVQEMILAGLITEYQVDEKKYWHVTGWHHQKIEKPNYKHPPFQSQKFGDKSATSRRPIDPVKESKGKESKGKEGRESSFPRAHEDFPEIKKTPPDPAAPDDTPLPDRICDAIAQWVETDRGIDILKRWKRDTGYSDSLHGPTTGELRKFITHHLTKPHRDRLIAQPVTFFTEQFPGWLANSTQFNRPRNGSNSPPHRRGSGGGVRSRAEVPAGPVGDAITNLTNKITAQ